MTDEQECRKEMSTVLREIAAALDSPRPLGELVPTLNALLGALEAVIEQYPESPARTIEDPHAHV